MRASVSVRCSRVPWLLTQRQAVQHRQYRQCTRISLGSAQPRSRASLVPVLAARSPPSPFDAVRLRKKRRAEGRKNKQSGPSVWRDIEETWGRLLYNYYNWRQDTSSDLQLVFLAFVCLILGNALLRSLIVHAAPPADLVEFWEDMYEVIILSFGQEFPEIDSGEVARQVFSVGVAGIGLSFLALVLALVEQVVLENLEQNVRQGSRVYEKGHVLILGWCNSQRDLEVVWKTLEQQCYAHRNEGGAVVVVLTQREKLEMEALFRRAIPESERFGTRFVFRQGNPLIVQDLDMVAAKDAQCIMIIADQSRCPEEADAQSLRCAILLDELTFHQASERCSANAAAANASSLKSNGVSSSPVPRASSPSPTWPFHGMNSPMSTSALLNMEASGGRPAEDTVASTSVSASMDNIPTPSSSSPSTASSPASTPATPTTPVASTATTATRPTRTPPAVSPSAAHTTSSTPGLSTGAAPARGSTTDGTQQGPQATRPDRDTESAESEARRNAEVLARSWVVRAVCPLPRRARSVESSLATASLASVMHGATSGSDGNATDVMSTVVLDDFDEPSLSESEADDTEDCTLGLPPAMLPPTPGLLSPFARLASQPSPRSSLSTSDPSLRVLPDRPSSMVSSTQPCYPSVLATLCDMPHTFSVRIRLPAPPALPMGPATPEQPPELHSDATTSAALPELLGEGTARDPLHQPGVPLSSLDPELPSSCPSTHSSPATQPKPSTPGDLDELPAAQSGGAYNSIVPLQRASSGVGVDSRQGSSLSGKAGIGAGADSNGAPQAQRLSQSGPRDTQRSMGGSPPASRPPVTGGSPGAHRAHSPASSLPPSPKDTTSPTMNTIPLSSRHLSGHVIVEMKTSNAVPLLKFSCSSRFMAVPTAHLNARRLAKMIREPIIATLSQQLMDFKNPANIYVQQIPELVGERFGELHFWFDDAIVIGVYKAVKDRVFLVPSPLYMIAADDHIVLLRPTFTDTTEYKPRDAPVKVPPTKQHWQPPQDSAQPTSGAGAANGSGNLSSNTPTVQFVPPGSSSSSSSSNGARTSYAAASGFPLVPPTSMGATGVSSSGLSSMWGGPRDNSDDSIAEALHNPEGAADMDRRARAAARAALMGDDLVPGGQAWQSQSSTRASAPGYPGVPPPAITGSVEGSVDMSTSSYDTSLLSQEDDNLRSRSSPDAWIASARSGLTSGNGPSSPSSVNNIAVNSKDDTGAATLTSQDAVGLMLMNHPAGKASRSSASSLGSYENVQTSPIFMVPMEWLVVDDRPRRVLVCGWGEQSFMRALLRELDQGQAALPMGSEVVFANNHETNSSLGKALQIVKVRNISVTHVQVDPMQRAELVQLNLERFSAAIVLCDERWVDPDEDAANGVDMLGQADMLRLDSMVMMVQLNVRKILEDNERPSINIICQKVAMEGMTRFEDRKRLPLGISVNFTSFAAKLLTQASYSPMFLSAYSQYGASGDFKVMDASVIAMKGERLSWWQLVARAQALRKILIGWYLLPERVEQPMEVVLNPQGATLRSKKRVWNKGNNTLKFVLIQRKNTSGVQTPETEDDDDDVEDAWSDSLSDLDNRQATWVKLCVAEAESKQQQGASGARGSGTQQGRGPGNTRGWRDPESDSEGGGVGWNDSMEEVEEIEEVPAAVTVDST